MRQHQKLCALHRPLIDHLPIHRLLIEGLKSYFTYHFFGIGTPVETSLNYQPRSCCLSREQGLQKRIRFASQRLDPRRGTTTQTASKSPAETSQLPPLFLAGNLPERTYL